MIVARNITVIILKAYTAVLNPSLGVEFSRIIVAPTLPGFTREAQRKQPLPPNFRASYSISSQQQHQRFYTYTIAVKVIA